MFGGATCHLAWVLFEGGGDAEQAEGRLRDAMGIKPEYAEAHSDLADALSAAGRLA
jgi:Tfp pilus assembly protein PilF